SKNVADLSRDVEHANNALTPIFDKEKEQNRLREINLIGDIGNQIADIARTQGKIGNVAIGIPGSKERINYGQVIGNYIDPQTGISTPTTKGIVHYGKNGVHIVPARP
uniref:polymorphic toxin type 50 domain-containing protein n=1 Tax=Yersinia enterocolitica TaxID=630 RepID=UPI00313BCF3C